MKAAAVNVTATVADTLKLGCTANAKPTPKEASDNYENHPSFNLIRNATFILITIRRLYAFSMLPITN